MSLDRRFAILATLSNLPSNFQSHDKTTSPTIDSLTTTLNMNSPISQSPNKHLQKPKGNLDQPSDIKCVKLQSPKPQHIVEKLITTAARREYNGAAFPVGFFSSLHAQRRGRWDSLAFFPRRSRDNGNTAASAELPPREFLPRMRNDVSRMNRRI